MKFRTRHILLFLTVMAVSCSSKPTFEELKKYAATETYPEDTYLATVSKKTGLVITAHDDDEVGMSGTLAKLSSEGWEIKQLCLQRTPLKEGRTSQPSEIIHQGNSLLYGDQPYRSDWNTTKLLYLPKPKDSIDILYKTKEITDILTEKINAVSPTVIFMLDHEFGAYGHPDHIFISQIVYDLVKNGKTQVDKIYESVYTNSMEYAIFQTRLEKKMKEWGYPNGYTKAQKLYQISGMPEPTTQITINQFSEKKMQYMKAYHEEAQQNFRKAIPFFNRFNHKEYFDIFDREFFRVLSFSDKG